ncbi:DUF7219 family protein [Egbenema bharatensis]|uniref:DUF7219 family protein n=1 Tax=Egbenema bharatensis TaxID=3463334 RepID=UPI003A8BBA84
MTYTKALNQTMFPYARYRGKFTPENLVFNANLQEFAHRVSTISALQTGGKLGAIEAFQQIEALWQQLEASQEELGIDDGEEPQIAVITQD